MFASGVDGGSKPLELNLSTGSFVHVDLNRDLNVYIRIRLLSIKNDDRTRGCVETSALHIFIR
jgi:hypothetical protein